MGKLRIQPYINFQGRAKEALEFYHRALGGSLDLQSLRLELDDSVIQATDGHPSYPAKVGENMALALSGNDRPRVAAIFEQLAEGGTVLAPLAKQSWGGEVGWLRDKFAINWTVSVQ